MYTYIDINMRAPCCGGRSVFMKNIRKSYEKHTFVIGNSMGWPIVHGVDWMTRACFCNTKIYRKSLSSPSIYLRILERVNWGCHHHLWRGMPPPPP